MAVLPLLLRRAAVRIATKAYPCQTPALSSSTRAFRTAAAVQGPASPSSSTSSSSTTTATSHAAPPPPNHGGKTTHFGFQDGLSEAEKTERVAGVFHSVAESYDRMNDLMSFGWHRIWKYALPPPLYSPPVPLER